MATVEEVLSRLEGVRKKHGYWIAQCPAHDDQRQSLSVSHGIDGKLLMKCHAGCDFLDIMNLLKPGLPLPPSPQKVIKEVYPYQDETGKVLYEVVRFDPKDFRQRVPDGAGGYLWSTKDIPKVLYRLPRLVDPALATQPIFIVEGEKDVHTLEQMGVVATTVSGGANVENWKSEFVVRLAGRKVYILPDNDPPGWAFARYVAKTLIHAAEGVKIVKLPYIPEKGDVSDWVASGGTKAALGALCGMAPRLDVSDFEKHDEKGFTYMDADSFVQETIPPVQWVWHDTLPMGGVSILAAKPKVGKSTLARVLAKCVAEGSPFLGRPTTTGTVLYLNVEEKRDEIQRHYQGLGVGKIPLYLYIGPTRKDSLMHLKADIERLTPSLVILDPIFKFVDVKSGDLNDYLSSQNALQPIIEMARETNCHIMAVHHLGKGGDNELSIIGSTAILGAVDTALVMRKDQSTKERMLYTVQRYGNDMEEMKIDLDASGMITSQGTTQEIEEQEADAAILECLQSFPGATQNQIREFTEKRKDIITRRLKHLIETAQVIRDVEMVGKTNKKRFVYSLSSSQSSIPVNVSPDDETVSIEEIFEEDILTK